MMTTTSRQLCTFMIDELLLGVDVGRVQEVLRAQRLTPVPLAPPVVAGLINLRGQIVTALDVRGRLGRPVAGSTWAPMNLVVRAADEVVSLLVDKIGDVVSVGEAQFERAPQSVDGAVRELITGAYKLDRGLLLELDIDRVIAVGVA